MSSTQLLRQLVSIASPSGAEQAIQTWIAGYLKHTGLHPQQVEGNVVCHIEGKDMTKALIFNGHVDTVAAGDLSAWHYPPFEGMVEGGRLYGLGASDMKSGLTVMLMLAEAYGKQLPPIDIWLHFVVQEETTGQGTKAAMDDFHASQQAQYQTVSGVLLESTGLEAINIAHKGNIFLQLTTHGDSGHGSTPEHVTRHAIEEMYAAITTLKLLVASWTVRYADPLLGAPTIVLTSLQGGSASSPNKIAETCTATLDLRTTPTLHAAALDLIRAALAGQAVGVETVYDPLPCGYTDPAAPIVTAAQTVTGLPLGTTPGSTDMLFFSALSIPAIIIGPGEKSAEHMPNEYVELAKIDQAFLYIKALAEHLGS